MSTTDVELVLSRTGKRIEVSSEFSFTSMVNATAVPSELLAPGMERALQAVEAALFGCVCENPDPSLAWLLGEGPRSLRWIAGPPSLLGAYTLRKTVVDAFHIAIAAVHGMDYLLSWNCRHIANAMMRARIEATCRSLGVEPPTICTPIELAKE